MVSQSRFFVSGIELDQKWWLQSFLTHLHEIGLLFPSHSEIQSAKITHFPSLNCPSPTILGLTTASMVTGKSFQGIPSCLTFLDMSILHAHTIFDSDVQHLPRRLKYAYFSNSIHWTDLCVHFLTPNLEKLFMLCNRQITASCFPNFPTGSSITGRSINVAEPVVIEPCRNRELVIDAIACIFIVFFKVATIYRFYKQSWEVAWSLPKERFFRNAH